MDELTLSNYSSNDITDLYQIKYMATVTSNDITDP